MPDGRVAPRRCGSRGCDDSSTFASLQPRALLDTRLDRSILKISPDQPSLLAISPCPVSLTSQRTDENTNTLILTYSTILATRQLA